MESAAELWLDFEGAVENLPLPPVRTRAQVLPLASLTWENFERLCYRLAWSMGQVSDCRRYGTQGEDQQGIDLYVLHRPLDQKYTSWQCKRHQKFSTTKLKSAVDDFLAGEWAAKTSVFHVVVSDDLSGTKFANAIEKARSKCSARGIEFVPLDESKLSEMLKQYPELVDDFFDRAWVKEFCGDDAVLRLSGRKLPRSSRVRARQRLRNLYATHFATVDVGLPATASPYRSAAPPLPLTERYVAPLVEAVTSTVEGIAQSPGSASEEATNETDRSKGHTDSSHRSTTFKIHEQRTTVGLFDWFATITKGIVLGGPGVGKSAAMRFLAMDLLSTQPRNETLARKWGRYLPLFLPFAMFARLVKEREITGVADFLGAGCKS